jgi:uncharacterized membrane protein
VICATTCLLLVEPSPWLAVFGRCHPVLLHLPLGVLPATALLEFGALLLRRDPPRGAVTALAWLAALTGVLAAASGLVLAGEDAYGGDTVGQHKVLGFVLAGLLLVAAVLALGARRLPFRLTLLAAFGVMLPAGHLGGTLTHGEDFLFQPLHPAPAKVEPAPPGPGDGRPVATGEYERTIAPFLERTCAKCHNPTKHKGDLVLTTAEGIRAGGENGPVLVAGRPDASPMLAHCELPLDDDDHMPPKDKPQPTAAELAALRAWIAAGAEF